jgi:sarcosine oxidase subunit beta
LQKAAVVIIGGGVTGCSVAYHLSKSRIGDVILMEKEFIASKATGVCPGGIRQQWSSETGCLLAKASVDFFKEIGRELAPDIPLRFVQSGYVFLAFSQEILQSYARNVALQNSLGIPSRMVRPEEMKAVAPGIQAKGIVGGAYCPEDGFLEDSYGFSNALAKRAKEKGVRIVFDEAEEIILQDNCVCGVTGKKGDYRCEVVVNAAGCDAAGLAGSVGVELPVIPSRKRLLYTQRFEEHFLSPCIASIEKGWGGKQLQEGHFYMAYIGEGAEDLTDYEFIEKSVELGLEILPRLKDAGVLRVQQGYYDMTPDGNPILGGVEGLTGYYQAAGFSGHGFMLSPAVGKVIAQMILGEEPFVDVSGWRLDRFRGGIQKERLVL